MYPADFASQLNVLTLAEMKKTIHDILDLARRLKIWMLFGTLPVFPCLKDDEDQKLLSLRNANNVTTRNDPDGGSLRQCRCIYR